MEPTPKLTFWESLCRLAGPDQAAIVSIQEAVDGSAVNRGIANAHIHRLVEEGILEILEGGESVVLTDEGRKACVALHGTKTRTGL